MTKHVVALTIALIAAFASSAEAQGAMQLGDREIYIVNNTTQAAPFSLKPSSSSEWSAHELASGAHNVYGSAERFDFAMSTKMADGSVKEVQYTLNGGTRYAIIVRDGYLDLTLISIGHRLGRAAINARSASSDTEFARQAGGPRKIDVSSTKQSGLPHGSSR